MKSNVIKTVEYQVRHIQSGLYSDGGHRMQWSEDGKAWRQIGHLKNHLRQHAAATKGGYNHNKRADPDRGGQCDDAEYGEHQKPHKPRRARALAAGQGVRSGFMMEAHALILRRRSG